MSGQSLSRIVATATMQSCRSSGAWPGQVSISLHRQRSAFLTHSFPPLSESASKAPEKPRYEQLTILTSKRPLPQLVARVYAMMLERREPNLRVVLKAKKRHFLLNSGEVDLEKWAIPDESDDVNKASNYYGRIYAPPGLIGWYMPKKLAHSG